jgi:hypothetical protein
MFECFVNKHVNDCCECLDVIYWFDENEKCFTFVVNFDDEFIIRCFFWWDIVDNQFFEILSDEFIYVIVFVIDNKLFKTTFKFWTCFECRITIDKTFFRFFVFFFDMIRWSTCKFITYETDFKDTSRRLIMKTKVKCKLIIVTIVEMFTTILSIR